MTAETAPGLIEITSPFDVDATLDRLTKAIEAAGLTVFARFDHADGARRAGLAMPPTVVLVYGSPKGGTPIMLAAPHAALDLPLRVLVRQAEDGTRVAFRPMMAVLRAAGVPDALAGRLEPAQALLIEAIRS